MIDDSLRKTLADGTVICSERGLLELLYQDIGIDGLLCDDERSVAEWINAARLQDCQDAGPMHGDDHASSAVKWSTPAPWADLDLEAWCIERCTDSKQMVRVREELDEFQKRGMFPVMLHMLYCVDVWRRNGIIWGVGRGSSVSSFVLYLIGINRINPLDHDLDFIEWLK